MTTIDPEPADMEGEELARARLAFTGALEAARAWRAFSPKPKHHDLTYWSMLTSLFAAPGMNRTALVERIVTYAGVSRSTAERAIREGRDDGYVVDEPAGREVLYYLSPRLTAHCVAYFRNYMDQAKIMHHLGYDRG
jgi:hypothetical protein